MLILEVNGNYYTEADFIVSFVPLTNLSSLSEEANKTVQYLSFSNIWPYILNRGKEEIWENGEI